HWWCYGTTLGGLKRGYDIVFKKLLNEECKDSMDDVGGMIPYTHKSTK
ncbi:hypothetical protein MCHI_000915, partial [Candidatus Magnetoovum chiemensis]